MSLALTVLVWELAVAAILMLATVIVGALIGLVTLVRGHREDTEQPPPPDVVWIPGRKP